MHVVCNDTFQCASSYKPRPLRHENQPGLPDSSACNIEKYGEAWIQGYTCTKINVHVHVSTYALTWI